MSNKLIGKLYEKRGDDRFDVVVDPTGDVVGITQFENGGLRSSSIDLFVESIPALVELLQKASGIKTPKVEYEYNIETTDLITGKVRFNRDTWEPNTDWLKRKLAEAEAYDRKLLNAGGGLEYKRRLVKRVKAGQVEAA